MIKLQTSRNCPHCGSLFTLTKPSSPKKYCSHTCYSIHHTRPFEQRFWEKVDKDGPVPLCCPELGPCWIWTAGKHSYGYGYFSDENWVPTLTHRISWRLTYGPLFQEECVLHRCDNQPCVRPSHLFKGDRLDNAQDMVRKGRSSRGKSRTYSGVHWTRAHPELLQGEANPHSKLTDAERRDISLLYHHYRLTQVELASIYPVSQTHVSHIVSDKRYLSDSYLLGNYEDFTDQ